MDRVSFVFSLLLIFSVTLATFGSVIKAKNPNREVKKGMDLCYCLSSSILFVILEVVSLELFMAFLVLLYAINELRIVTLA